MGEERFRGAVGHRPPRGPAPPARAHPAGFEQHVERALRGRNAADFLHFGAGDRLVVGDDRQHLEGSPGQLALVGNLALQQPGEVFGGSERPLAGHPNEDDPAPLIVGLQTGQNGLHIGTSRHTAGDGCDVEWTGGGKQQRFDYPFGFEVLDDGGLLSALGFERRQRLNGNAVLTPALSARTSLAVLWSIAAHERQSRRSHRQPRQDWQRPRQSDHGGGCESVRTVRLAIVQSALRGSFPTSRRTNWRSAFASRPWA